MTEDAKDFGVGRRRAFAADDLVEALLLSTDRPLSTYDIRDRLGEAGERLSIPLIYRAVGRLVEAGKIRRVESINGYIASRIGYDAIAICARCSQVTPLDVGSMASQIRSLASHQHLTVQQVVLEVRVHCATCKV